MQRAIEPAISAPPPRPTLDLSGPKLRAALERLVAGADAAGGIERWVTGLKFKAVVFARALDDADGNRSSLDEETFLGLCALMPTVRRRIAPWLAQAGVDALRALLGRLFDERGRGGPDTDARIAAFCAGFPGAPGYRYARDLAAELLHFAEPERYPLMARWIWDRSAGTGVMREIWHDDNDPGLAHLPDTADTFLVLREELAQYLTDNGFFRDVPYYVDLLCAQVYAGYIVEQGGAYLRTDFSSEHDPMQYVRRMLGLDGIDLESGVTRLKLAGGGALALRTSARQH